MVCLNLRMFLPSLPKWCQLLPAEHRRTATGNSGQAISQPSVEIERRGGIPKLPYRVLVERHRVFAQVIEEALRQQDLAREAALAPIGACIVVGELYLLDSEFGVAFRGLVVPSDHPLAC